MSEEEKGNEQWNMNPDVQRFLKDRMPASTITQWESVRGCVNSTAVGAPVESVGAPVKSVGKQLEQQLSMATNFKGMFLG